ncbi:hypothetical protein N7540_001123 [Penicillium herquei]|nr:hypothetical protein N7540_001123 [Penicillium herquei]
MRRHYFGPSFGISTESLMYTEVDPNRIPHPRTSNSTQRTSLVSIEARVCINPPGLGLRIQRFAVVKSQDVQNIFHEKDIVLVCTHLATHPFKSPDFIKSFLKSCYPDFSDTIKALIKNYCQQDEPRDGVRTVYKQGNVTDATHPGGLDYEKSKRRMYAYF